MTIPDPPPVVLPPPDRNTPAPPPVTPTWTFHDACLADSSPSVRVIIRSNVDVYSYTVTGTVVASSRSGVVGSTVVFARLSDSLFEYAPAVWNDQLRLSISADRSGYAALDISPSGGMVVGCIRPAGVRVSCTDSGASLRLEWDAHRLSTGYRVEGTVDGVPLTQTVTPAVTSLSWSPPPSSLDVLVRVGLSFRWSEASLGVSFAGVCPGLNLNCPPEAIARFRNADGEVRFARSAYDHDNVVYDGSAIVATVGQRIVGQPVTACPDGRWAIPPTIVAITMDNNFGGLPCSVGGGSRRTVDADYDALMAAVASYTVTQKAELCAPPADAACNSAVTCASWTAPVAGPYAITIRYQFVFDAPEPTPEDPDPEPPPPFEGTFTDLVYIERYEVVGRS